MNIDKLKTYLLATAQKALNEYAQLKGLPDVGSISYGSKFDHAENFQAAPPYIHIDRPRALPRKVNTLYYVTIGFFEKSEQDYTSDQLTDIYINTSIIANAFIKNFDNNSNELSESTITGPMEFLRHVTPSVVSGVAFEFTFEGVNEIC